MARKKKADKEKEVKIEQVEEVAENIVGEIREEEKELSTEEKKQEEMKRVEDCTMAIKKVLDEYGCALDASVTLRHNQVIPDIRVMPLNPRQ